jgi:hypothetical protein
LNDVHNFLRLDGDGSFVVSTNSVHPIDLACLVLLAQAGAVRSIRVLLSHRVRVSDDPQLRAKQPQYTVPVPSAVRERSGTVRQLFVPTGLLSDMTPREAVVSVGLAEAPKSVRERARVILSGSLKGDLGSLIAELFRNLAPGVQVHIENYEDVVWSLEGQGACLRALFAMAKQAVTAVGRPNIKIRWRKGGYIELRGTRQAGPVRCISVVDTGNQISVFLDGIEFVATSSDGQFEFISPLSGTAIALRGPLELAFLAQLGQLSHISWYCDHVSSPGTALFPHAVEPISPIAASSVDRSGAKHDSSLRLNPLGYSLVDYDHAAAREFVSWACRLGADPDLSDWSSACADYPQSNQKSLKTQSGASDLVHRRLAHSVRGIRDAGSVPGLLNTRALTSESDNPQPEQIGLWLIALAATSRCLAAALSGNSTPKALEWLESLRIPSRPDDIKQYQTPLSSLARSRLMHSKTWRKSLVPPEVDPSSDEREVSPHSRAVRFGGGDDGSIASYLSTPSAVAFALEREAVEYYAVVIALCSGPLKAHIWNLWLVFGDAPIDAWTTLARSRGPGRELASIGAQLWTEATGSLELG